MNIRETHRADADATQTSATRIQRKSAREARSDVPHPAPPPGQSALVMLALAIGILLMTVQLWLLTLALNLYLADIREGTIIAALISGLIFLGGLLVLRLLEQRPSQRS
ncbi:MAG TPA: hypothetical protein VFJ96_14520 [Gemmatimonadaceae bacterium]|nr:hypothetical protein [Gemmatimonadaceae bacterium]